MSVQSNKKHQKPYMYKFLSSSENRYDPHLEMINDRSFTNSVCIIFLNEELVFENYTSFDDEFILSLWRKTYVVNHSLLTSNKYDRL